MRVECSFAEESALGLLEATTHARKQGVANEGHLVHNEEHHTAPLLIELPERVSRELVYQAALGNARKPEQSVFAPKPMLKAATPVYEVRSAVASTPARWNRRRLCCATVFIFVDLPLPAEPHSRVRSFGSRRCSPVSLSSC